MLPRAASRALADGICSRSTSICTAERLAGTAIVYAPVDTKNTTKMTQVCGCGAAALSTRTSAHARARELGEHDHTAALEVIGDRTTEDRAEEQREHRHEAEQADHERRARLLVHLERGGDACELRASRRDADARPQQAEVSGVTKRRDVDRDVPQAAHQSSMSIQTMSTAGSPLSTKSGG